MLLIGHRGAAGLAPENTLEAFRAGVEAGADMLEFDVRLTNDGVPVVLHDASLIRTHRQYFSVEAHSYAELESLGLSPRVPHLEEVIEEYYGRLPLNIELKSIGSGEIVAGLLTRYLEIDDDERLLIVSSFRPQELYAVRLQHGSVRLALLHAMNPFRFLFHRQLNLFAVGFFWRIAFPYIISRARNAGLNTYVYTVDSPVTAKRLVDRGVDWIVTNRPDLLRES